MNVKPRRVISEPLVPGLRLSLAALAAGLIVTAAAAGSAIGAGPAPRATTPSSVGIHGWGFAGDKVSAHGRVTSPRRACFDRRVVRVYALPAGGKDPVLLDTDATSRKGYWGAIGKSDSTVGIRATIARKRIGKNRYCAKSETVSVFRPTAPRRRAEAPTSLSIFTAAIGLQHFHGVGKVNSRKPCKTRRRVELSAVGKDKVAGFDLASRNGYFGLDGEATAPDGWRITAPAKRISDKLSCRRATIAIGSV